MIFLLFTLTATNAVASFALMPGIAVNCSSEAKLMATVPVCSVFTNVSPTSALLTAVVSSMSDMVTV